MVSHWLLNNYTSLIDISIYIYIFIIILVYIHSKYYREKYIDDWDNYKCKPYIIPISGIHGFSLFIFYLYFLIILKVSFISCQFKCGFSPNLTGYQAIV